MAGPEVPQHGALNIGYQSAFEPLRLNSPIALQAADWAGVGRTAMDAVTKAGQMLQQSPLNPDVREAMNYAIAQHKAGEGQIAWAQGLGPQGKLLGRTTAQGYEQISPAESGASFAPLFMPKTPPPAGTPPPPPAPKGAPGTGKEPQEKTQQPGDENHPNVSPPPPANLENPPASISGATSANESNYAYQGPNQAQTAAAIRDALSRNQFASSEQGVPAGYQPPQGGPNGAPPGTFLNPATGSYEPLQQGPPATPSGAPSLAGPSQRASGIWSPMRPSPAAPPAPAASPSASQGQVPAPQSDPVALAQWQAANVHPVIAPKAVLDAVKTNVTTAATDASYLPSGGVNGEPAWAIGMKGGGHTVISASQLAQSSWGRTLMAGHNASEVMEAQAQGQQPGVQGGQVWNPLQPAPGPMAPQGLPSASPSVSPSSAVPPVSPSVSQGPQARAQYPNISGPPPAPTGPSQSQPQIARGGQVWNPQQPSPGPTASPGPPPAPAGPLPDQPQIAQGGQVWNPNQPAPGPQAPVVPGAYDPTPYRQAVAQAIANPQNLVAQENPQAGVRSTDTPTIPVRPEVTPLTDQERAVFTPEAIAAARANAQPVPNQPSNDGSDPPMGDLGPWHLYRDDRNQTNELYAVRPGLSSLFKQQRYYLGSDGWHEYDLPNTNTRLAMEAEFGGGKGGVAGATMPNGKVFPTMSHDDIANLSVPAMQQWLKLAGQYHNTTGEPNSTMDQRFNGLIDLSQRTQRLIDGQEIAQKEGIPSEAYSKEAQRRSRAAADRDALKGRAGTTSWNPIELLNDAANAGSYNQKNAEARGEKVNSFSDYLEEQVKRMNDAESQLPGRQIALQKPGQNEGPSVSLSGYGLSGTAKLGAGAGDSVSPHRAVNRLFENASPAEAKAYLLDHKAEINRQFEQTYADAIAHNYRLTPAAVAYHNLITHGSDGANGSELDKPGPDGEGSRFRDSNGHLINPFRENPPNQSNPAPARSSPGPTPPPARATPTPTPVIRSQADLDAFKRKYPPGTPFVDSDGNPHTYQSAPL
jgi:hypothetical protein